MSKRKDWTSIFLAKGVGGKMLAICKEGDNHVQFPGGKRNRKDRTPEQTATREGFEELGVRFRASCLNLKGTWIEHNHKTHQPFQMYLYEVFLTREQFESHFSISKEGEKVGEFTWTELNELYRSGRFSPYHHAKAVAYGVWRTK